MSQPLQAPESHPTLAAYAPPAAAEPASFPLPAPLCCANCFAPLAGHFCGQCGAPRLEERPLTVRRFASDLWTELTSVDSATIRSVRALLLEPGRLTREYLDGRTRWYLSPLRLFLLAATLQVFVASASGYRQRTEEATRERAIVREQAVRATVKPTAAAAPAPSVAAPAKKPQTARQLRQRAILRRFKPDQMMEALLSSMAAIASNPWLQIGYPLSVAAALGVVLRRKRRNYAEHFVHALHFMAFSALVQAALVPLRLMTESEALMFALYWVIAARYFYLSVRRVYADPTRRAVADTALFAVAGQSSMMVLPLVAAVGTVLWLLLSLLLRLALA